MHLTTVIMKDGKTICGYIKRMRPKEGYIILEMSAQYERRLRVQHGVLVPLPALPNQTTIEKKILLKDAISIVTEGERISIANRYANEDELARCRELGWDGN
jgi:hypothetical protein